MDNPWGGISTISQSAQTWAQAQPQPTTYDANGYIDQVQQRDWGQNPYQAGYAAANKQAESDSGAATTGITQGMQSLQKQMGSFEKFMNAYPSFPNSGGFGSQGGFENLGQSSASQTAPTLDASARGANPWSLTGEASSR